MATRIIETSDTTAVYQSIRSSWYSSYTGQTRDLGDFLTNLSTTTTDEDLRRAVQSAEIEYAAAIRSNYTHSSVQASGMSIYLSGVRGPENSYLTANWSDESLWDDMLLALEI